MSVSARAVTENLRVATKARIKRASALARRNMNQLDRATLNQLDKLYQDMIRDLIAIINSYSSTDGNLKLHNLQQLLNQTQQRLGQLNIARDALLNSAINTASSAGVAVFTTVINDGTLARTVDKAVQFVQNFIAEDGLQLSDRVWRINNHASQIVGDAINNAVIQGHGASQAANELLSRGERIPADLNNKINTANAGRVANSVTGNLTASGSPRANAMRLFRTEINRAHGEAYMMTGEELDDFAGWQFILSPRHPETDICDIHARANLFGLGPGVYPSRKRTPWPAHPNTLSYTDIVFIDEISNEDKAGKTSRLDWLNTQPPRIQEQVLNSRRKRAALSRGLLRENEISTPWNKLKKRYIRRGIDVDTLKPVAPVKPAKIKGTLITGTDTAVFAEYSETAFKYAPGDLQKLIKKVRKPARIEVVNSGKSWYQGDMLRLSQTSMQPRRSLHSIHDVYRHEYGHFVDFWAKPLNGRPLRPLSSTSRSKNGLLDAINESRKVLRSTAKTQIARRKTLNSDLKTMRDTNLADVFGALTNNRVGWGHKISYLSKPLFRESEIFANLFDIYSRQDKGSWNFIKSELPQLAADFKTTIKEAF
jgi:hypothetical protein